MSKKIQKKVPEVRFAGFTDDWEQRRLGELGSVAMNRRIFKEQTSEIGDVPFFKIGTFGGQPDAFISRELYKEYKEKYPYPEIGDILISASGSIGRTVVYQGKDEYFQDSNIVWLKHGGQLNNNFLHQFYTIVKWKGLEGSTIKRLYNKNILDTSISIPSLPEQEQIGEFFKQLDNTIALHQRKLDQLKQLKQAYLMSLFPQNTERVPDLRFMNFEDVWRKKKLGEVARFYSGGTPSIIESKYYNGNIPFIRSAEINSNRTELFISDDGLNNSSAKLVKRGDILYALYGATSGEVGISKINGAINQAILAIQPIDEYYPYFIMQWLRKEKTRIIDKYLQGGQGNLSGSIVKELVILFPCYAEQQKIGIFFKQMDRKINLYQSKIEKIQSLKKIYLQKMFI